MNALAGDGVERGIRFRDIAFGMDECDGQTLHRGDHPLGECNPESDAGRGSNE